MNDGVQGRLWEEHGESRAERIARELIESDRYAGTRAFEEHIYRDEPIIRTGAQAFSKKNTPMRSHGMAGGAGPHHIPEHSFATTHPLPKEYARMRALARRGGRVGYGSGRFATGAKLFYQQGKYMESFEDDFDGVVSVNMHNPFPSYEDMSVYQLRCYFSWRTRLRKGEVLEAPVAFLSVYACELLCGIGSESDMDGYEKLSKLAKSCVGTSPSFDSRLSRWIHDYVVFHGLDSALAKPFGGSSFYASVALLRGAEDALLALGVNGSWPQGDIMGLPNEGELFDALCALSRYRAEKSRFIKENRENVAQVAAHVFARMVEHCHKRRKTGFVEGLFGEPVRTIYTMFPSAHFWNPQTHEDVRYELGEYETFVCERGFWWRELACRRMDTSKELGSLLHAIDARMRIATGYKYTLKQRPLPKYQGKFVDEEIAALVSRKKAEEAAQIHIDRSSLSGIRSAAVRTREALLTDDERADDEGVGAERVDAGRVDAGRADDLVTEDGATGDDVAVGVAGATGDDVAVGVAGATGDDVAVSDVGIASDVTVGVGVSQASSQQSVPHEDLLRALLEGQPLPQSDGMFLSLAVDAINEAFLDIVGDTVVEFDGDTPVLVEDYVDDVRDALE